LEVAGIIAIHNIVKLKSKERALLRTKISSIDDDLEVTDGIDNMSNLENIAAKPNLVLFGQISKYNTPIKKAACLMEGLARKHPFTDGNKRTAIYTAFAFLQNEGIDLDLKLVQSHYLVYVASDKSRSEEEIDMLIDEIEFYLLKRIKK